MANGGGQKAKRVGHFYIESAHQRIDFAEGEKGSELIDIVELIQ